MKNRKIICAIINFFMSFIIVLLLGDKILQLRGIFPAMDKNQSVTIYIPDEKNAKSYGHEARIVNVIINGDELCLNQLQNEDWVFHDDWGYILYQGEGDSSFVIDEPNIIKSFSMEYVRESSSGILQCYVGDNLVYESDMYRKEWKNCILNYKEVNWIYFFLLKCELFVIVYFLLSIIGIGLSYCISKNELDYSIKMGIKTFDFAKGFGMITIILIHSFELVLHQDLFTFFSTNDSCFLSFLYAVMMYGLMPMFFIISGMGFRKGNTAIVVKKQLEYWIRPYFVVMLGVILVRLVQALIDGCCNLEQFAYYALPFIFITSHRGYFYGKLINCIGPMWYGASLCFGWIGLALIENVKNKYYKGAIYFGVVICGILLSKHDIMVFCIPQTVFALIMLKTGIVMKNIKILRNETYKIRAIYILLGLMFLFLLFFNGMRFSIAVSNWGDYYVVSMIMAIMSGIVLVRLGAGVNLRIRKRIKVIEEIGFNSYYILYIHAFEYLAIPWDRLLEYIPGGVLLQLSIIILLRASFIWMLFIIVKRINKHVSVINC